MSTKKQPEKTFNYSEPPEGSNRAYINHVNVTWTGVDVTLLFGELLQNLENIEKGVLAVEYRSKITMPWSVAKLLADNLRDVIERYEKANGELKLPGQYLVP